MKICVKISRRTQNELSPKLIHSLNFNIFFSFISLSTGTNTQGSPNKYAAILNLYLIRGGRHHKDVECYLYFIAKREQLTFVSFFMFSAGFYSLD